MAEGLLRAIAAEHGLPLTASSTGLLYEGKGPSGNGVEVLAARGIDIAGHRSRILAAEQVAAADLVLAMAREHLRETVVLAPDAFSRTFTIRELARKAPDIGRRAPDESLEAWLERAHEGRDPREMLRSGDEDDVADPIGKSRADYEHTAEELDRLLRRIVRHLLAPELQASAA